MFKINKNLISLTFILSFTFVLSLLALSPTSAKAYYFVGWEGDTYVGYSKNNNPSGNNFNNGLNPIPSIYSVSPNATTKNTNTTITVKGNNFVPGSIVRFNSYDKATTFIDSGTLRAQLDYYDLNNTGNYLVTVYNPAPGGGFSNALSFTVNNVISPASTFSNSSKTSTVNKTSTSTKEVTTNTNESENTDTINNQNVKDLAASAIFGYNGFLPSSLLQWLFFAILILLAVILWRRLYVSESDKAVPLKHA